MEESNNNNFLFSPDYIWSQLLENNNNNYNNNYNNINNSINENLLNELNSFQNTGVFDLDTNIEQQQQQQPTEIQQQLQNYQEFQQKKYQERQEQYQIQYQQSYIEPLNFNETYNNETYCNIIPQPPQVEQQQEQEQEQEQQQKQQQQQYIEKQIQEIIKIPEKRQTLNQIPIEMMQHNFFNTPKLDQQLLSNYSDFFKTNPILPTTTTTTTTTAITIDQQQQNHIDNQSLNNSNTKTSKNQQKDNNLPKKKNLSYDITKITFNNNNIEKKRDQTESSKNFREKKKEYVKEIESKILALTLENDKLKKENDSLKTINGSNLMRPEPESINMIMECKKIIKKLEKALIDNDERSLIYLLYHYHSETSKRYSLVEIEVDKIANPYSQIKLKLAGYIQNPTTLDIFDGNFNNNNNNNGNKEEEEEISWFIKYKNEANLTIEQSNKLDLLRNQHGLIFETLLKERKQLDNEILKVFNEIIIASYDGSNANLISDKGFELKSKLKSLKMKIISSLNLNLDTFSSISSILLPKQEALLLVRAHLFGSSKLNPQMDFLNNVWTNIISSNSSCSVFEILNSLKEFSDLENLELNKNS
ncbi:hypothetical protein DDB_G0282047 [Dictyostelium discoideum AX4]|uniref:Probable basic-leucine zipper transcription factor M n=1 Tax=Dictyostelium discoideum TaxID=44689 RepID=BZPM_DICDI|nr:hypothetical protein DDB_G0282047 [Dictyostelium discoideum AX4]Q54T17.1 RecName: Full=Probable basic-leucine zipper transcription factor M [Dictyostelium discoideum]EAL66445.1 hypothetical protein DDB_G0282047 [Dictyostelium discoideum AX4]|eukprot:XP_640434.1 hypothetical protein DDB_G0282047 [Dictyostelium discoideum AX4]